MRVKARKVDPICKIEDVERLRTHLIENYKFGALYALFVTLGCNLGLRAGDILNLKVGDLVKKTKTEIVEQKTGKLRTLYINDKVQQAVQDFCKPYIIIEPTAKFFYGRKGSVWEVKAMHKLLKQACRDIGLVGNYGTHSLRKTFAYHVYMRTKCLLLVRDLFNHSDLYVTKLYIGQEVNFKNEEQNMLSDQSQEKAYLRLNI